MLNRLVVVASGCAALILLLVLVFRTSEVAHDLPNIIAPAVSYLHGSDFSLQTKLAHAEELWEHFIQDRKQMEEESGYNREFPDGYIYPYNVWDFSRPTFFCPHDMERVGKLGDGGKVVCGMTRYEKECPGPSSNSNKAKELIVYSFGVNDDSSFEAAMLERTNARIWGYDYSVDSWGPEVLPHQHSRAKFAKMAIGKKTDLKADPPMSTIHDLMKANGHTYIDLVKMDIEGAEFDALLSWVESVTAETSPGVNATLPFGQLLIELHFFQEPPGFTIPKDLRSWTRWLATIESMGLRPMNNEDNWIGDVVYGRPRFMEVRSHYSRENKVSILTRFDSTPILILMRRGISCCGVRRVSMQFE